jgi:hypothetical protein
VCCNDKTEQVRYFHDSGEAANADAKVQLLMGVGELVRSAGSLCCCKQLIADFVGVDKKFTDFNLHKVCKSTTQQIDVNQEPCTSINS